MKTIDGKRIEELRIGQEVWSKSGSSWSVEVIDGGSVCRIANVTARNFESVKCFLIDEISTVKPRKKVLKMLYCFRRIVDGKLCWELKDEIIHSAWERVPENDFEAEIFE